MRNIQNRVDKLAGLLAKINALKAEAGRIEKDIKAAGVGEYKGREHYANVYTQEVDLVDWKAVAERLDPSRQLIAAHTKKQNRTVLKLFAYPAAGEAKAA